MPFNEIATIVDRSPETARQLASRARRRVRGATPEPDADPTHQRDLVDAFLTAARDGDLDALVAVLDPDVVLRAHRAIPAGTSPSEVRGAATVTRRATTYSQHGRLLVRPALINGIAGWVTTRNGQAFSVGAVTVRHRKIVEIDIIADPARLSRLDLTILDS